MCFSLLENPAVKNGIEALLVCQGSMLRDGNLVCLRSLGSGSFSHHSIYNHFIARCIPVFFIYQHNAVYINHEYLFAH